MNGEKTYEKYRVNPICIEEVYLYLKERHGNKGEYMEEKIDYGHNLKILGYCLKFCTLQKEKIRQLRTYINKIMNEAFLNDEERIQAEIILCKIIDFKYLTFKSWIQIFQEYKKYFKSNQLRKYFKSMHSIISS